jgi:hypothetical protein
MTDAHTAIGKWLSAHRNVRRPLTVTPRLLAVVCGRYELELPVPSAGELAQVFKCSPSSVRSAIETALDEGEITEEHSCGRRNLLPSAQLYDVWKKSR